ncbi:energy transducer TonB [bacterium]|nr:energy transducer TonB [bacterium]
MEKLKSFFGKLLAYDGLIGYASFLVLLLLTIFKIIQSTNAAINEQTQVLPNQSDTLEINVSNLDSLKKIFVTEKQEKTESSDNKVFSARKIVSNDFSALPKPESGFSIENEFENCFEIPEIISQLGLGGEFSIKVKITKNGNFEDFEIINDELYGVCTENVLKCLKSIKWIPPQKNGVPVPSDFILPLFFEKVEKPKNVDDWQNTKDVLKTGKAHLPTLEDKAKKKSAFDEIIEKKAEKLSNESSEDFSEKLKMQADTTLYNLYSRRAKRLETPFEKVKIWKSYLQIEPDAEHYKLAFLELLSLYYLADSTDLEFLADKEQFWKENEEKIKELSKKK